MFEHCLSNPSQAVSGDPGLNSKVTLRLRWVREMGSMAQCSAVGKAGWIRDMFHLLGSAEAVPSAKEVASPRACTYASPLKEV